MYIDSMNRLSNMPPISEQLKKMKADVNSNKGGLNNQRSLTLSIERHFSSCDRSCVYFKDNMPCRTTVEINALPTPIAIELKCIATID